VMQQLNIGLPNIPCPVNGDDGPSAGKRSRVA
jgi:hypothetical protein